MPRVISVERAERIARSHACERCQEYSFKRLTVKPATKAQKAALAEAWHVLRVCGVCGLEAEMGIDADGDIVFSG